MSEFKFACPVCGQHITADSNMAGSQLDCPTCFRKIVVPQGASATDAKFILAAAEASKPRPSQQTVPGSEPISKKSASTAIPIVLIGWLVALGGAGLTLYVLREKIFHPNHRPEEMVDVIATSNGLSHAAPLSHTANASADGGGNNLALGKPASAGSQEQQNPARNGNDGNGGTRWCASSARVPQWWKVDLGDAFAITNTVVTWEHGAVYQYKIEMSPDGTNWTMAVNRTANSISARVNADNCSATGRYVRLTVTGLRQDSWASFYEFQVFGSASGGSIANDPILQK